MSSVSSTEIKERVRQSVDIVDVVGNAISLRRQGRIFVGLCPFHDDSKPSLQVNPERQTWKCWVCGDKGGDVFSWVMERERVEFKDALKLLAEKAGIALETRERPTVAGSADDKKTLFDCCAWAEKQFHEYLLRSEGAEPGRKYLEERSITPHSVERFKLGFCPNEWSWLVDRARKTAFTPAVLEAVNLIVRNATSNSLTDQFKGRVIFPIHDTQGRCIAFGGRILPQWANDRTGKYINSKETRLFSKSEQLYALDLVSHHIRQSRSLTVVEGYTDVVMCHQQGVQDVVACLGTAITPRHIQLIRRFADTVNLVLDGDAAGQRRTNAILDLFVGAQVDLRILTLPEEFDPCEFLLERTADDWRTMLATQAVDALEHKIRVVTTGLNRVHDTHRANAALEEILKTMALAPRPTVGSSSQYHLREKQILARLAREFAVDSEDLVRRLADLRKSARPVAAVRASSADEPVRERRVYAISSLLPTEVELLQLLTRHPELAPTALAEIGDEELGAEVAQVVFQTYRRLEETGENLEFSRVLSEFEDAGLQSLLVGLDEQAEPKMEKASEDPATRMRGVIRFYQRRREERQRRETEAALEKQHFNPQEEMNVLELMLASKRQQQGIVAPTDG